MPHPLLDNNLSYNKALTLLSLSKEENQFIPVNRKIIAGDHWQNGEGYTGPEPAQSDKNRAKTWAKIKRLFCSKNVVLEIVRRQANALLVKTPMLTFDLAEEREQIPQPDFEPPETMPNAQPPMITRPLTDEEAQAIDEAQKAFQAFWQDAEVQVVLKRWLKRRLWGGRAALRLFIPARYLSLLQEGATGRPTTLKDAIKLLSLDEPDVTACKVMHDKFTGFSMGLTKFTLEFTTPRKEIIEVCFVDDQDQTFVATLTSGGINPGTSKQSRRRQAQAPSPEAQGEPPTPTTPLPVSNVPLPDFDPGSLSSPLDLAGQLVVYETTGDPLVSNQLWQLNKLLNLALTMGGHVIVESGYSEMALTNVNLPDEEVTDDTGKKVRRPKDIRRGSGVANNFIGVVTTDESGAEVLAAPTVQWKEPSPITTHRDGKDLAYQAMLEEAHQLHALITGDAAASGDARIQALVDFVADCLDYKTEVDAMGFWLMRTSILLAAALIGQTDRFKALKPTFDCKIYVGELKADERNVLITEVDKKLRSKKSYRSLVGILDNEAEEAQIRAEAEQEAAVSELTKPKFDPNNPLDPANPNNNLPPKPNVPPARNPAPPANRQQ